jgi:hypothetical protein
MIRFGHFPRYGCQVVNVIKVSYEKKEHGLRVDSKEFGVDLIHTGLTFFAQQALKSPDPVA